MAVVDDGEPYVVPLNYDNRLYALRVKFNALKMTDKTRANPTWTIRMRRCGKRSRSKIRGAIAAFDTMS